VITDSPVVGAHRWITVLANDDLPDEQRLSEAELDLVVDGNRRQDWPKELLVHLNTGLAAYVEAIVVYQSTPELQAEHFLLSDRDTPEEAAREAQARLRRWTREAVERWTTEAPRALTLVGKGCHLIQDSYSTAHTRRDPDTGCIRTVKAYVTRAPGFLADDIEFHGEQPGSLTGHSTPEDSLFTGTSACREAETRDEVEVCMQESARAARAATADYFALLRELVARGAWDGESDALVDAFIARHLAMCAVP
jgi:hypothetical protein